MSFSPLFSNLTNLNYYLINVSLSAQASYLVQHLIYWGWSIVTLTELIKFQTRLDFAMLH